MQHGDYNHAFLGDEADIVEFLPKAVVEGVSFGEGFIEGVKHVALVWPPPAESPVVMLLTLAPEEDGDALTVTDMYPAPTEGTRHRVIIDGIEVDEIGQAVVRIVKPGHGDGLMWTTARYWPADRDGLPEGTPVEVMLAGIAVNCGPSQLQDKILREGEFFENERAQFLEVNPDKAPDDFPRVHISCAGVSILLPIEECPGECVFNGTLLQRDEFVFQGRKVLRLLVRLLPDSPCPTIPVFVPFGALNENFDPRPGDDISGVARIHLWPAATSPEWK